MVCFFFFNDPATTKIYTLSLHDALPISSPMVMSCNSWRQNTIAMDGNSRSEEHTSELQSHSDLVCRLLLEKKKKKEDRRLARRGDPSPDRHSPIRRLRSLVEPCVTTAS